MRAVLATAAEAEGLPAGTLASSLLDALPNDAFYVRWHSALPDVALADWRLRIAGPAAQKPREPSQGEILCRFKRGEVAAVNQCSGNRRGLFSPHVPGVQWGYRAMGNAVWGGVRLKDLLEDAGLACGAPYRVPKGMFGANESSVVLAPGAAVERVQSACAMCHSLNCIVMNSPFQDRAGWEKTVTRMVKVMGAPLTAEDTAAIVAYLDAQYGKAAPAP